MLKPISTMENAFVVNCDMWELYGMTMDEDAVHDSANLVMNIFEAIGLLPETLGIEDNRFLHMAYRSEKRAQEVLIALSTPTGLTEKAIEWQKAHPRQLTLDDALDGG